ncbi:MAG: PrsW family intramembrane metalloprotease [Acaryochloris sp. RU_4_1]|nr:PrsW family intramembrane metalloprotease [Acaryochloris sp. RU_4_1]NJR53606.1 PrsW family intramembrane metalloprotease [Acaryochloris sp. CRU_2_0]
MENYQPKGLLRLLSAQPSADASQSCYSLSVTAETALGRTADCQVIIDSNLYGGVSRRHAVIRPLSGALTPQGTPLWQICDLNSANGTYVNGQRIQGCQTLNVGDRIMLSHNGPQFLFEHRATHLADPFVAPSAPPAASSSPPFYPPQPPPVVGSDQLTVSQLFPIVSARQDLWRKGYLVPGVLTVILVVLLFIFANSPGVFNLLLALYLGGGGFYFIYRLCGKKKPWWVLFLSTLFTMVILVTPILSLFILIFRGILPGNVEEASSSFIPQLISHFFGAGLMEELLKALPIFGFFYLGSQLRPPSRQKVGVWEPLDGILIGAASALGFTLVETLGQYVPGVAQEVARSSSNEFAGALAAVQLLIPRVLGSVTGHMAYSGIFGYFIGLSILKPSKRWQILGIGYLTSAGIHAFWNASGSLAQQFGNLAAVLALMIVGVSAYTFLAAAILKARQLSPTRAQNFATRIAPPS